jgi:phage-related protein
VQAAASGQAEAYASSTEGGLDKMGQAFGELQESIGALFLPVLEAIIPVINDFLLPALQELVGWIGDKLRPIFVKLQPLLERIGEVFAAIAPPILDVLGPAFDLLAGWIGVQVDAFILLIDWLGEAWGAFQKGIEVVQRFVEDMGDLPGRIVAVFADAGRWLLDAGVSIVQGLIDGILSMAGAVLDAILSLIPAPLVDAVSDILGLSSSPQVAPSTFGYGVATRGGAGVTVGSPVSITIHTAGDPQAVEQAVVSALRRYGRLNGVQVVG